MEKLERLDAAIKSIEKEHGRGSIMRLGDNDSHFDVEVIPTGSIALDIALGVGGLPRGRVVEIFGPEMSGKSTLALQIIATAQRMNGEHGPGICAYIDAENVFERAYAEALGVKTDDLLVSQPDTGEQAFAIIRELVQSAAVDVIVIDSVAALVPKAEIEGEIGDSHVGLQARLMSQSLRMLSKEISKSRCLVVFINQLREKIGVAFGNPETTPGGRALKFYSSIRIDLRRSKSIKKDNETIGNEVKIRVVKNKVAPPFKTGHFDIIYNQGVSREGEIVDLGVEYEIIDKSGAWYTYKDEQIGQGKENAKQFLNLHDDISAEIEEAIREKAGIATANPTAEDQVSEE